MSESTANVRFKRAVTAAPPTKQQIDQNGCPTQDAKKSYRPSNVSRTLRVPHELVPKLQKLIAAYRTQQRNDHDTY